MFFDASNNKYLLFMSNNIYHTILYGDITGYTQHDICKEGNTYYFKNNNSYELIYDKCDRVMFLNEVRYMNNEKFKTPIYYFNKINNSASKLNNFLNLSFNDNNDLIKTCASNKKIICMEDEVHGSMINISV